MQARFKGETGESLNIGDTDEIERELNALVADREPVDILSRVLAHLAHRIPLVKRVEKRLEGTDPSSGIASDILAFFAVMYLQNRDVFERASRRVSAAARARSGRKADSNGAGGHTTPFAESEVEERIPAA